ncbi:hypothetical protein M413DRAFT_439018 [Hebeloma cylindrosporum]|uniref:DUF6593 domain-containing protein n=1 Tax=Hebeloma cylindrosporum TaxID=76867 RepID=A0A0C3D0D7_HEBCY|nr:hypothetical protein M413DRAFT_439018 [Hebeloma cylindrosporum h7]
MANTRLIISSRKPYNATYHTEEGEMIYKVEAASVTPGARTIKISKAIPSLIDDSVAGSEGKLSRSSFGHLATIEYRMVQDSWIRMGGTMDISTGEYFRKEGWTLLGRNRIFTGPDGREYIWKLGPFVCKLFVNDSDKTPVAFFHRRHVGIIGKARPASLEIFEAGRDMIDLIVVTGVYMAKLRKDKERAAR